MTVDTNYVLNGTDQKKFNNARAELEKEYNQSTAHDFFYDYYNRPLSFLLKNSRNIFSETYYGLDFYRDLIEHQIINPMHYASELEKVKAFINEAKAKRLPTEQVQKYIALAELLENKCKAHHNLAHVFKRAHTAEGAPEYFSMFFDMLNDPENRYEHHLADDIFSDKHDPYIAIPAGYCMCLKNPHYCNHLFHLTRKVHDRGSSDAIKSHERGRLCIREMMQDEAVRKNASKFPNINLYPAWATYATSAEQQIPAQQPVTESVERNIMLATNPIEAIFEAVEDSEMIARAQVAKYDRLKTLSAYLDVYQEYANEEVLMGERDAKDADLAYLEDAFEQAEIGMACMEWEADGSPNAVIKNHIMTVKEREAEEAKKAAEKNQIRSEEDSMSIINDTKQDIKDLSKDHLSSKETAKRAEDMRDELSANLHKEALAYPEVKNGIKDVDAIIASYDDEDDDYEEEGDTDENDEKGAPSDKDPNQTKPKKPKQDLPTRVQNKALDADAKMTQKESEIEANAQKFKNAGNAIAQHPKKLAADIDQTIASFDKWDDNRRKEFILKPGFRHRIFKKFRGVLQYGAAASIGPSAIPILWMIRRLSKQKDKRIRNELAMELDNEIKICEEKIQDANSAGDQDKKYQLMRIKDKLEAERTRVRVNSKYV